MGEAEYMLNAYDNLFKSQSDIIQLIASGKPLEQILTKVLTAIESTNEELAVNGTIMLYDPHTDRLNKLINVSLPEEMTEDIQTIKIGPYNGPCAIAAFLKQPVYVHDIESDPTVEVVKHKLVAFGYQACLSKPILSKTNQLLGTICLWFKEKNKFNRIKFALEQYAKLAAIAIQMAQTNDQLNTDNDQTEQQGLASKVSNDLLVKQLQKGLERDEFDIFYQPYFTIDSGKLGIEALLRWNHPYAGTLRPHAFIDVAEETGFIIELEKWVLKTALQEATELLEDGIDLQSLSINISAKQLVNNQFPYYVKKLLDKYDYPPENLTLEITERFLVHKENVKVLHKLKQNGIQISIDDFGTAYSTLNYLKDLPVDELKIDRSFIHKMDKDIHKQKIVEMIIVLGQQLGLTTVAEGVETKRELQLLKEMQCHAVQGFYFSKPVSFSDFKAKYIV